MCVSESVAESFYPWESFLLDSSKKHIIHNGAPIEHIKSRESEFDLHEEVEVDPEALNVG